MDKLRLHLTSINTQIFFISKEIALPISRNKNMVKTTTKKGKSILHSFINI